jgi:hypothetical protein
MSQPGSWFVRGQSRTGLLGALVLGFTNTTTYRRPRNEARQGRHIVAQRDQRWDARWFPA